MLEKILKSSIAFLLIIIPVVFFFVANNLLFPFVSGKNFIFRALIDIALILYIVLIYINKDHFIKSIKVLYAYISFLTIVLISNIFGANFYSSTFSSFERMEGYITHLYLFIYFVLLVSIFKKKEDWRKVFGFVFVISILVFTFGFAQLLGQKGFYSPKLNEVLVKFINTMNTMFPTGQGNGLRIDSTFGNSAYSAVYFMFVFLVSSMYAALSDSRNWIINTKDKIKDFIKDISCVFVMFLLSIVIITEKYATIFFNNVVKNPSLLPIYDLFVFICYILFVYLGYKVIFKIFNNKISPYLYLLLSVSSLFLLYYTQTRGTYIATLVSILFIISAMYINRKYINNSLIKKFITFKFYSILTVLFVFVSLLSIYSDSKFVKENLFLNRISTVNLNVFNPFVIYNSIQNDSYKQMVETFGEATLASRVMNIGMAMSFSTDNLKNFLLGNGQENYIYIFSQYHDSRMFAQEPWFDRAHNVLFDWLTASGILGLIAYLSIFILSIFSVIKNNKFDIVEKYFLSGALIGYFLHNLFVFDSITSYIMFIILIGYIASQEENTFNLFAKVKILDNIYKFIKLKFLNQSLNFRINIKKFLCLISIIIVCIFAYRTVIVPFLKSSVALIYLNDINNFAINPKDQGSYQRLMSSLEYMSKDNTLGEIDSLTVVFTYLHLIINEQLQTDSEDVLNKKMAILENINSNLIKQVLSKYNNEKIFIMVAGFYDNIGQGDWAHHYYEKAEEAGGKKPLTKLQYAISLYKHGKTDQALQKATEAYNLNKENPKSLELLNFIMANSKQK